MLMFDKLFCNFSCLSICFSSAASFRVPSLIESRNKEKYPANISILFSFQLPYTIFTHSEIIIISYQKIFTLIKKYIHCSSNVFSPGFGILLLDPALDLLNSSAPFIFVAIFCLKPIIVGHTSKSYWKLPQILVRTILLKITSACLDLAVLSFRPRWRKFCRPLVNTHAFSRIINCNFLFFFFLFFILQVKLTKHQLIRSIVAHYWWSAA